MINLIEKNATGKKVILFVILLVMAMSMMQYFDGQLKAVTGPIDVIDLQMPIVSVDTIQSILTQFGEEGRARYKQFEMTADILYPIVYGIAYTLLLSWLLFRVNLRIGVIRYLPLMPFTGMVFDFFENIGIIHAINSFPLLHSWGTLIPFFNLVKWVCGFGALISIVLLLIYWGVRKIVRIKNG